MSFTITLSTVAIMLLYTVPGFFLTKKKLISDKSISSFASLLVYVLSPCQTLYCVQQIEYSGYMVKHLVLSLFVGLILMGGMLGIVYFVLRKKQADVRYRVCTCASALGNCGFMGVPLVEALLPEYPQAVAFTSMFFMAFNLLMWTMTCTIITRDKRYISIRKVILNPSTLSMIFSLILFFCGIHITGKLSEAITLLGKMCTPVCMLILGMRLANMPLKPIFTSGLQYTAVALKLIVFPLIALGFCSLLPVEHSYVQCMYIICCAPVGTTVLSFAELLGEGQDIAANVIILSTLLSLVTMPLMMLLV